MKKILITIFLGLSLAIIANGYERGILMNTSQNGKYYQEICPLGPPGTFLMSDPASPCGASWQTITLAGLPDSPLAIVIVPFKLATATSTAIASSKTVYLRSGFLFASSTITNLSP